MSEGYFTREWVTSECPFAKLTVKTVLLAAPRWGVSFAALFLDLLKAVV